MHVTIFKIKMSSRISPHKFLQSYKIISAVIALRWPAQTCTRNLKQNTSRLGTMFDDFTLNLCRTVSW